ncbi:GCC2 and GCC3 domain containing protein [Babesia caballi]|uniref:GCC2 and GCC3 domain containing protein n=1 Tax=Babesia caballi TaxID=5871 RepID=A0AAV4LVN7_BABCB|nr:GCC2 and GCC3 domain containing protein [Babesia caballi]
MRAAGRSSSNHRLKSPLSDLTRSPPVFKPKHLRELTHTFPNTLLGTLMREYCRSKKRNYEVFACLGSPIKCMCFNLKNVAVDSVAVTTKTDYPYAQTILGVPYKARPEAFGSNLLSSHTTGKCSAVAYKEFAVARAKADDSLSHEVSASTVKTVVSGYKAKLVRGETKRTLNSVLKAYMQDPICTLGSNLYKTAGWVPHVAKRGTQALKKMYSELNAAKLASLGHKPRAMSSQLAALNKSLEQTTPLPGAPQPPSMLEAYNSLVHELEGGQDDAMLGMPENHGVDKKVDLIADSKVLIDSNVKNAIGYGMQSQDVLVKPDDATPGSGVVNERDKLDVNDPLRYCGAWDVLKERHDLDVFHPSCGPAAARLCEHDANGLFCHPVVQARFYVPTKQEIYVPVDRFTFSAAFGAYLGPVEYKCGSASSIGNGAFYTMTLENSGVRILDEITRGEHRYFNVGPFPAETAKGTYTVCACMSNDAVEDDVRTCLTYKDYTTPLGHVVVTDATPAEPTAHAEVGQELTLTVPGHIALLVDVSAITETCHSLVNLYSIDWKTGSVARLPSRRSAVRVLENDEKGNVRHTFTSAGLFRICLVNEITAEVQEHAQAYVVAGVRSNAEAVIYRNQAGDFLGSSLVFEHYGGAERTIDALFVTASETDCAAPSVGRWSDALHPYYTHTQGGVMRRWVARDLRLSLDDSRVLHAHAICVKYSGKPEALRVGVARVQNYFDHNEDLVAGTPFYFSRPPDDTYNYGVSRHSEAVLHLIAVLAFRRAGGSTAPQVDNATYYYNVLGKSPNLVLHFRVYTQSDRITLWAMSEEDPSLYPLMVIDFDGPVSLRLGYLGNQLLAYIITTEGKLVSIPFAELCQTTTRRNRTVTGLQMNAPTYMDIVQMGPQCYLVVVETSGNCIHLVEGSLKKRYTLNLVGDKRLISPGRISCSNDTSEHRRSCFLAMPVSNEVLMFSVAVSSMTIKFVARYTSGELADDLDPKMGPPTSLYAAAYRRGEQHVGVFMLRASGEHGALLQANTTQNTFSFLSTLSNVGHGYLMRGIFPAFNSSANRSVMLLCESYPTDLVDSPLELDALFARVRDPEATRWRFTWAPFHELVALQRPRYEVTAPFVTGQFYVIPPIFDFVSNRFLQEVRYRLEFADKLEFASSEEGIRVDTRGYLHVLNPVPLRASFNVVQSLLWVSSRIPVTLDIVCNDGMYFDGSRCVLCPPGTYNSVEYVIADPSLVLKCRPCPPHMSTSGLGATSADACTCVAGYTVSSSDSGMRCLPCSSATYKSTLGFGSCTGTCGKNAYSSVTGSLSEFDMFCRCYPGYYLGSDSETDGFSCQPCEEGYYCLGGYKAKQTKCPAFTTTLGRASKKLGDCVCVAGYEPAREERLSVEGTYEHSVAQEIMQTHQTIAPNVVCVPCGHHMYKDKPSSEPCFSCPSRTYGTSSGNTTVDKCNRCAPGYFETNDPTNPCEICPANHICVGSDPVDPGMMIYSGKRVKCDKNSTTLAPYEGNVHVNNCLCNKGYMARSRSGIVKCDAVPRNTYKDVVGNIGPTQCPHGSYTVQTGATSVSECVCKEGMYFDQARKACAVCPPGKYCLGGRLPNGEHMLPMECEDPNTTTKEVGASSAHQCLCNAGYYMRSGGPGVCIKCPENTYKGHVSNDACSECHEHSFTAGIIGATSRDQCVCAPGYYFDRTCKPCGYPDKYCPGGAILSRDSTTGRDVYETRAPVQCPPHTEITPGIDTADSVDSCKCAKGYALAKKEDEQAEKVCVPCPPGTYKSSVMDSSCNGLCTQNATSEPGAYNPGQCFCQRGYYYLAGGICAPCVEGASCDGGLVPRRSSQRSPDWIAGYNDHVKPVPVEGYYLDKIKAELRKPDDWRFIKCPIKGACLGRAVQQVSVDCDELAADDCVVLGSAVGEHCDGLPERERGVQPAFDPLGGHQDRAELRHLHVCAERDKLQRARAAGGAEVDNAALVQDAVPREQDVLHFDRLSAAELVRDATCGLVFLQHVVHRMSAGDFAGCGDGADVGDIELFKIKCHAITRSKLALLHQSSVQGMHYLSERLREEYSNERLFLIFRYIPLPGETRWVRFKHFLEDMIPIYVTVLFSVHGNTTSQMLSLLDCTCIHLGQSIPSKYVLRPAMSIKCSLDPSKGYVPYLLLGLGGLIFWGFGIPFFSYIVLLMNRKNLYAPDVRMKYGFLHNGYQQDYWFWEAIVFTRKSLVLVIGSIVIVPSKNTSGSRIWMALSVAVIFLIIQLIYKPFDERDYFVLGRLESHSMISWTASLLAVSLLCSVTMTPLMVTVVCAFLIVNSGYFLYVVLKSSARAFVDTIKHKRDKTILRKLRKVVDFLLLFESRRQSREPLIRFDQRTSQLQLRLNRKRSNWLGQKSMALKPLERYYFVNIVTELYRIVVCHLKLDVMPKLFVEFLIRLSLSFTLFEEKMAKKELFKDLADGDLTTLVAWATEKESQKLHKIVKLDSMDGGRSIPNMVLDDKNLSNAIGLRREELQYIMDCLFDDKVLEGNTNLPDLYHSITRIWIMDTDMLTFLFSVFRHVKTYNDKERLDDIETMNVKLRRTATTLRKVIEGHDAADLMGDKESLDEMKARYDRLVAEQQKLASNLKAMHDNPDAYVPGDKDTEGAVIDAMMEKLGFTMKDACDKSLSEGDSSDSEEESDSDGDSDSGSEYTTDDSSD